MVTMLQSIKLQDSGSY